MSDQPEKPVAPQASNVPAGAAALEPPPSPVKIMKNWFRAKASSSKNKDVLKSVKSHQLVAPPDTKASSSKNKDAREDLSIVDHDNALPEQNDLEH